MTKPRRIAKRYWWDELGIRPVWVEITRRPPEDIGININHYNTHTFGLLDSAAKNDHVLHWSSTLGRVYGCSTVSDAASFTKDGSRHRRLTDFVRFPELAITLDSIRRNHAKIRKVEESLATRSAHHSSLHYPFAPYGGSWQHLRPQLKYLTAAPPELVAILGSIYEARRKGSSVLRSWASLGLGPTNIGVELPNPQLTYKTADELVVFNSKGLPIFDSGELEKSAREHSRLQNQAADWLKNNGIQVGGSQSGDPLPVDIQWASGSIHVIGEVKSLKSENEVAQMRRGIGQVLHYRKLFEEQKRTGVKQVEAALIVSRKPDDIWVRLCADLRIRLAWPSQFGNLTYQIEVDHH